MPIPERPQALQRQSAKSVVYQTVCDWIITGVMKPGEKILDSELASYFNVSRTPVREALQLLQNQKLVCVIPGRTTVVADLDVEDFEKCYRPLAEIDALAAELACRNLTDAMLEELEQELQASAEANIKGDTAAIITHDTRFHELIIDAADNEYIAEISHMLVLPATDEAVPTPKPRFESHVRSIRAKVISSSTIRIRSSIGFTKIAFFQLPRQSRGFFPPPHAVRRKGPPATALRTSRPGAASRRPPPPRAS